MGDGWWMMDDGWEVCNIRTAVDNLPFGGVCNHIMCYPKLLDMARRVNAEIEFAV